MAEYCQPLIQLLGAIRAAGSGLESLLWRSRPASARPPLFWTMLWYHAPTLCILDLNFAAHEVHSLPPPQVNFPALRTFRLNAEGAHGDNGSSIDTLLKSCPGLEALEFRWPRCDLTKCQIRNVTWDYKFADLKNLRLSGWDFAYEASSKFLAKCVNVEYFGDDFQSRTRVECSDIPDSGPQGDDENAELDTAELDAIIGMMPKLKHLSVGAMSTRGISHWFNPIVKRPITRLRVTGLYELTKLADLPPEPLERIMILDIETMVTEFGPGPWAGKGENQLAETLKNLLPRLKGLEDLALGKNSQDTFYIVKGELRQPPTMSEDELRIVLALLPQEKTNLRRLQLSDQKAAALGTHVLADLHNVPEGLEMLRWRGQVTASYRFERDRGIIKAVPGDWRCPHCGDGECS